MSPKKYNTIIKGDIHDEKIITIHAKDLEIEVLDIIESTLIMKMKIEYKKLKTV
ncbi:hypothetical protein [Terrisporobacter vanillatitrophus]|uniref:hypothetical protein n=1 Tax=Terrisporobacter vanillatitrophus TaxID=3058402 RepID=UPI003EBDA06A